MKTGVSSQSGLSLLEVLALIATLTLIALFFLPMLAGRPVRSNRISCTSNLKHIGISFRLYGGDHGEQFPWKLPITSTGSLEFANSPQVFRHFAAMSNELLTPKVLICPADKERVKANDFVKFSNSNLSYFVCLDATDETQPQQLLTGDRNIIGGITNGALRLLSSTSAVAWTSELHNNAGNIGLGDGSVQQMNTPGLQKQLQAQPLSVIRLAIP